MIDNYNFLEELNNRKNLINNKLEKLFTGDDILSQASNYALMNDGKRIRPILLVEFAKLFNVTGEKIYIFAMALELIHNYSLIHDDLPSMDNDDYRRGKLTVHKKFGEDIAILAGDSLLNSAYEIIIDSLLNVEDNNNYIKAVSYLPLQSGKAGMIGGQIIDIDNKYNNESEVLEMYIKKTCGLIKAACKCGAILGHSSQDLINLSEEFGEKLGLSFQIKDDILDYYQDIKIGKITIANLYSVEYAEDLLVNYSQRALTILDEIPGNTIFLKNLVNYLVNRDN